MNKIVRAGDRPDMRFLLLGLILMLQGAWAMTPRDLAGLWVLESVEQGGRTLKDPRWQVWLELKDDGRFFLRSVQVLEKRTTTETIPVELEVKLQGTWALEPGILALTLDPPGQDGFDWAKTNLGTHQNNVYRPGLSLDSGLQLDGGARKLCFRRNERS